MLYSADGCPFAHRARIALSAAGAKPEIVEINLKDKPEWYQPNINPASKVPAIWYDAPADADVTNPPAGTFILPESALIVDFVASVFPQITLDDPVKRAQSYYIAQQYDALVSKHWALYSRSKGGKDTQEYKDLFDAIKKFLTYVPEEFVNSSEYSVADILIAPFLTRLYLFAENQIGLWSSPAGGEDVLSTLKEPEYEKFAKWHAKLAKWPAVTETIDLDALLPRMKAIYEEQAKKAQAAA